MPLTKSQFIKSKVCAGEKLGRKIGYPTLNLNPRNSPKDLKIGVYSCLVKIQNRIYKGVLYFGPRLVLGETKNILEIHILNFSENIYNKMVEFKIGKFIRSPKKFENVKQLKEQLGKDLQCT